MGSPEAATAAVVAARMRDELRSLDRVIALLDEALAQWPMEPTPHIVTVHGIGGLVHDYYTGLEKLFQATFPELSGVLPTGDQWHRELLRTMALELRSLRPAVISGGTETRLVELLRFRHLYRHQYGYRLRWSRVRELAADCQRLHPEIARELEAFFGFLDTLATHA